MGTDIHGVFQRLDKTTGQWHDVASNYEQDRHYQLFAVLADVRNGYGFAGIPTGEVVTPIAKRRGLPADFAMDGDSHPIATLEHMDPSRRACAGWCGTRGSGTSRWPTASLPGAANKPPRRASCYPQSRLATHNRQGLHLSPKDGIHPLRSSRVE